MNDEQHWQDEAAPTNWIVTIVFGLTFLGAITIVPWYGIQYGFSLSAWVWFAVFLLLNGVGIGSGYHRLWSHRTFNAHWSLRLFLALAGAQSLQNSILIWCSRHRVHHKHVDENDKDPYSIGRGFWFAHIGWMLKDYQSGAVDLSNVPDLERDPIVRWQHRFYWPLTWGLNLGLPMLIGWLSGDFWGVVLLAGLLRLVINHHVTFFINSLAHIWGKQPYTDENSARDNWFIALLTYGEGYHNFHHKFQNDYRNGVRWWQFDINKWFISLCAGLGLARDLRRVPRFKILRAKLQMEFRQARSTISSDRMAELRELVETEYQQFKETVRDWQQLQGQRLSQARNRWLDKWSKVDLRTRLKELEYQLKMQRKRLAVISATAMLSR